MVVGEKSGTLLRDELHISELSVSGCHVLVPGSHDRLTEMEMWAGGCGAARLMLDVGEISGIVSVAISRELGC